MNSDIPPPSDRPIARAGERVVRCPGCGGVSLYAASNPSRPFCSARCRNQDFGSWASENYRVAAHTEPDDEPPGTGA